MRHPAGKKNATLFRGHHFGEEKKKGGSFPLSESFRKILFLGRGQFSYRDKDKPSAFQAGRHPVTPCQGEEKRRGGVFRFSLKQEGLALVLRRTWHPPRGGGKAVLVQHHQGREGGREGALPYFSATMRALFFSVKGRKEEAAAGC